MVENIILFVIASLSILFIALMWLRQSLLHELHEAQSRETVLQKDFEKRRDTVPYLLEGARQAGEPTDTWRRLAEDRAQFHKHQSYQKELEFEKTLHNYLQSANFRTVHFLDAKKDIEELSVLIEQQKQDRIVAMNRFNERCEQFPYSLAKIIFGFKKLS